MIWIFHLAIITMLLLISKKIKKQKFFFYSSFLYSIFIFGQRWMTGTDYPNYLRYYLTDFQVSEPGYYYLQKILAENNLDFGLLIFIILFITLFNNYRFILQIDKNVEIILFLYLISEIFFAQMSQIRQFIAISFFLNSFFHAYENKMFKSIGNIIIGALFHDSIIFLFPFIFIRPYINRINGLYLLVVSAVLPLIDLSPVLNLEIFSRYSGYLDSVYNVELSFFHYFRFYIIIGLFILYLWNIKTFKKNNIEKMLMNAVILYFLIYGLSFQFALFLRVSNYFKIFEIVFLVYYFDRIAHYSKPIVKTVVVGLCFGIYLGTSITDPYRISDYQFRSLRITNDITWSQYQQEANRFWN